MPTILAGTAAALALVGVGIARADVQVSVALSLSSNSIAAGEQVTMTAVVTATGDTLPAGAVTFSDNGDPIGSGNGQTSVSADGMVMTATWTTQSWTAGTTHQIVATYASDWSTGFGISADSDPQTLNVATDEKTTTQTTIDVSEPVIRSDQTVTFTAHVTTDDPNLVPPGGSVTFRADGDLLGTAPVDHGVATLEHVGGWASHGDHTYVLTADYLGDVFASSNGRAELEVHRARVLEFTYVGDTTVRTGEIVRLAAHVTSEDDDVANLSITLGLPGGESCTETTDGTGLVTCWVRATEPAGSASVTISFDGDKTYLAKTATTGSVDVTRVPTGIAYTGPAYAVAGQPAVLSATVTSTSLPVPLSGSVTFTLGAATCTAPVTAGLAHCTVTPLTTGTFTAAASFGQTAYFAGSATSATVGVVTIFPTTLTYVRDTSAPAGGGAEIAFLLKNQLTDAPVPNAPVLLSFNGADAVTVLTDANGIASLPVTAPMAVGNYDATASFAGDATYAAAGPVHGNLNVTTIPTTTTYTSTTTTTPWGSNIALTATLTALGQPLPGKTLSFVLATGELCLATTDAAGIATCSFTITMAPSPDNPVTVTFAGDPIYITSSAGGHLAITKANTTLTINTVAPVQQNGVLALTAHLTPNAPTVIGLGGRFVTLGIGTTGVVNTCTGLTDSTGTITCAVVVPGPAGDATISARYLGDIYTTPATASGTTIVYALAPGGGAFVIGDRTATGSVTFWGSQWAKVNTLSGVAPSDFKGFAGVVTAPTQCGATWTTRPGNSTPPPNGPLPKYMAVVVSSSIGKSGSAIMGDVKKIVIVKTAAGYDGNPGHAGTGTVVAPICGG